MKTEQTIDEFPDVPSNVFNQFLNALKETDISSELIERLRKTLLEDKKFTDRALEDAIFNEETLL